MIKVGLIHIGILVGGVAVAYAASAAFATSKAASKKTTQGAKAAEANTLAIAAKEAYQKGDYALAESNFTKLKALDPTDPFLDRNLALVYDAQHRDREAFFAWQRVMEPAKHGYISDWSDPRSLTRYGVLCAKFGESQTARQQYEKAVSSVDSWVEADLRPTLASGESLTQLESDAHVVSTFAHLNRGESTLALPDALQAVTLAPKSALAHLAYAKSLAGENRFDEAKGEYLLARQLGRGATGRAIQAIVDRMGLSGDVAHVTIDYGHVSRTVSKG